MRTWALLLSVHLGHAAWEGQGTMHAAIADNTANQCVIKEMTKPSCSQSQILVKVKASAINRADTLQRKGLYPPPKNVTNVLGLELAGEVIVENDSRFPLGSRVMALVSGGGNGEFACAEADHLMLIPDLMPWVAAAAIPETWLTAFQLLHFVAGIPVRQHSGDYLCTVGESGSTTCESSLDSTSSTSRNVKSVLIHAGASGVGLAAVQLAVSSGLRVYVTASNPAKINAAKALGAVDGFNYKAQGGFANQVLNATDGIGVDIVLDCVGGGPHSSQNLRILKLDGTWVLYGLLGGAEPSTPGLFGQLIRKRIKILSSTLRSRSNQYKAALVSAFVTFALPQFTISRSPATFLTVVDKIFPLRSIQAAHDHMESNRNIGKIILSVDLDGNDSGSIQDYLPSNFIVSFNDTPSSPAGKGKEAMLGDRRSSL